MLTFQYTARNSATGQKIASTVQADSERAAAKLIQSQGLVPIKITADGQGMSAITRRLSKVHTKDKVLFSRQLATLINAGLPLVQSLRSVNNQTTSKPLKLVINKVTTDVEAGSTLAGAMGRHPEVFSQVFLSLIAAGEASGTLDAALERLSVQQEKDADLMSKIKGAMVYPIIVLLVMFGVLGFMLVKVLPQVKQLYEGLGNGGLPLVTRILLAVSDFVIHRWWIVMAILAVIAFAISRWNKTPGGKSVIDRAKMKMWPVGPLFMKMYMARFARTGTTLISSGVPLIQMLEISGRAINNVHIENSLKRATDKVKGGKSLADAIQNDPNFLELVPNMLKIGEQSGAMEQMLAKTADYYEKEVDDQVKSISTIIEPVLMVVLGVVAFIIVAAVLLPIYGLANQAGGLAG